MAWFIIIIINDHEQHPQCRALQRGRKEESDDEESYLYDIHCWQQQRLWWIAKQQQQSNSSRWWQNLFHVQRTVSIFTSQSHGVLWFTFDISHNLGYQWRDLPTWLFEEILIVWKASAIWVICSTHAKNGWWSRGKRRKVKRRIPLLLHGAHVIRLIAICGTKGRQRT